MQAISVLLAVLVVYAARLLRPRLDPRLDDATIVIACGVIAGCAIGALLVVYGVI